MTKFASIAAISIMTLGVGSARADTQSVHDRVLMLMHQLQAPADTTESARRPSAAPSILSLIEGLFADRQSDGFDNDLPDTSGQSDMPTTAQPQTVTTGTLNRIFKRQFGPGQSADVAQHGSGNTATVLQSN